VAKPWVIVRCASGCGLSEHLARSEVFVGAGADHFRRAGSAGARGPPAARSWRIPYGWRIPAIPARTSSSGR
jgi:hypothetical protein